MWGRKSPTLGVHRATVLDTKAGLRLDTGKPADITPQKALIFRVKAIGTGRWYLSAEKLLQECERQTNTSTVNVEDHNSSSEVCSQPSEINIAGRLRQFSSTWDNITSDTF